MAGLQSRHGPRTQAGCRRVVAHRALGRIYTRSIARCARAALSGQSRPTCDVAHSVDNRPQCGSGSVSRRYRLPQSASRSSRMLTSRAEPSDPRCRLTSAPSHEISNERVLGSSNYCRVVKSSGVEALSRRRRLANSRIGRVPGRIGKSGARRLVTADRDRLGR
jgi:hypothetical protein